MIEAVFTPGTLLAQGLSEVWHALQTRSWTEFDERTEQLRTEIGSRKDSAVTAGDEPTANAMCLAGIYVRTLAEYGAAWKAYARGRYLDAWDDLVGVEESIKLLGRFIDTSVWGLDHLDTISKALMRLYPYRIFSSLGILVNARECSICGHDPYGPTCVHVPGHMYMGEFARLFITDFTPDHIALTRTPLDKRCIVGVPLNNGDKHTEQNAPVLKALSTSAASPLQPFVLDESLRVVDPRDYHARGIAAKCPCGSGRRFGVCCWRRRKMTIAWVHIDLDATWTAHRLAQAVPAVFAQHAAI